METNNSEERLLLVLRQQQSKYAVPVENVEEILTIPDITAMPQQPGFLRGVFSYKGRIVPVLSLQAISGYKVGADEAVCVVLKMGGILLALTADSAESLISDDGQRMRADRSMMNGELIKFDCVLPGTPVILVLDLKETYEAAKGHMNPGMAVAI